MKIFISWSKPRSHAVARALHDWIPCVLQAVEPWMSSEDIQKGGRWANEIGQNLAATDFGIICVTAENQASPWLLFEAGALSKSMERAAVATVLLDLSSADVSGPLAQFQDTKLDATDFARLLETINGRLAAPLPDTKLSETFDVWWPKLEVKLDAARAISGQAAAPRSERDILEDVLNHVRMQERSVGSAAPTSPFGVPRWFEDYLLSQNAPALPRSNGAGLTVPESSRSAMENVLNYVKCPIHDNPFTWSIAESGAHLLLVQVHGCCPFSVRVLHEHVKDLLTY